MKRSGTSIERVRPQVFWEIGEALLENGDVVYNCNTHNPYTVVSSETVKIRRTVRKNGKPLGPWLILDCDHFPHHRFPDEKDFL